MHNLIAKYRKGELSAEEKLRLRELLLTLPPDELDALFPDCPERSDSGDYTDNIERIKESIDLTLSLSRPKRDRSRIFRAITAAAAVITPLLIALSVYLFISSRSMDRAVINTISTCGSGKTEMTLSDGSSVTLRGMSSMKYPSTFNPDSSRNVTFYGQAYFNIAKDSSHPFEVNAPGFTVTVHGTSFGISAVEGAPESMVSLDSGSVTITSGKTNKQIKMSPGDIATINSTTSEISVTQRSDNTQQDWDADELKFNNATPEALIKSIEQSYGITLSDDIKRSINANSTGTLPWDDLATALKILSRIYGFALPY